MDFNNVQKAAAMFNNMQKAVSMPTDLVGMKVAEGKVRFHPSIRSYVHEVMSCSTLQQLSHCLKRGQCCKKSN
jgi:hypothetical protein